MKKLVSLLIILLLSVTSFAGPYEESRKAGIEAYIKGNYKYALKCFQSVLKIAPANNDLTNWIEKCKRKINDSSNATNRPSAKESDSYYIELAKKSILQKEISKAENYLDRVNNRESVDYCLLKGDILYLYKFAEYGWRTAYLKAAHMGSEEAEEKAHCLIVDNTLFTTTSNPKSEAEYIAHKADSLGNLHEYEQSFGLYLKAAEMGNSKAQLNVARFYLRGCGIERNFEKALLWAIKAAGSDDFVQVPAKEILAWFYSNGICTKKNVERAFEMVQNQKFGVSGTNNGLCNEFGFGTPINKNAALNIYKNIINGVNDNRVFIQAINIVGAEHKFYDIALERYCYLTCIKQMNDTTAKDGEFYLKLAVGAKALSGEDYINHNERIIYKDCSDKYYNLAYNNGVSKSTAIFALANHYKSEKEYVKALELYNRISDKDKYACMWLGNFYEKGYGVERNYSKAKEWYLKAKSLGNNSVVDDIKRLENKGY